MNWRRHGASFPEIGRLQGRADELRNPGLTGEPGTCHIQNLDAIRSDEGGECLPGRFDSGMQMQERLSVVAGKLGRFLRSAREDGLDAEYHRPVGIDDVLLRPNQVIRRIGLL